MAELTGVVKLVRRPYHGKRAVYFHGLKNKAFIGGVFWQCADLVHEIFYHFVANIACTGDGLQNGAVGKTFLQRFAITAPHCDKQFVDDGFH